MAKKTKKKVIATGLYNMVINPESLEKTAAEAEFLLTEDEMDNREAAKGFLDAFGDSNENYQPKPAEPEEEKHSDALDMLADFFK